MQDYQKQAMRTLSAQFHGDKVDYQTLRNAINNVIDACRILDACKKAIFYGRHSVIVAPQEPGKDCTKLTERMDVPTQVVMHGLIGCATETGEMLETLLKFFEGSEMDNLNLVEEMGDVMWYQAIVAQMLGTTFEEVQRKNIAKLTARYPDRFTSEAANERDIDKEQEILKTA